MSSRVLRKMSIRQMEYYYRLFKEIVSKNGLLILMGFCVVPFFFALYVFLTSIKTPTMFESSLAFSMILIMIGLMALRYNTTKNFQWITSGQRKWLFFFSLPFLMPIAINLNIAWFFVWLFAVATTIAYGNRPLLDETGKYLGILDLYFKNVETKRLRDMMLHFSYRYRQDLVREDEDGNLTWNLPEEINKDYMKDLSVEIRNKFEEMKDFRYYYLFYAETEGFSEDKYWLHIFTDSPISDRRLNYWYHTPIWGAGYVTPKQRKYTLETGTELWA